MLYCIGCDRPIIKYEPGSLLAISCICGAVSPILYLRESNGTFEIKTLPSSLVLERVQKSGTTPHLEYYLGYSSHISELKTGAIEFLTKFGSISQKDCVLETCQQAFKWGTERNKRIART